jgi:hypothetical protein
MSWRSSCAELFVVVLSAASCRPSPERGASLEVTVVPADADADLWIDGNYVGRVSDIGTVAKPVALAPGKHRVEVRKPGRFPVQRTVEVTGREGTIRLQAELLEDP